ncbi:TIGR01777 family oxidoreductase [Marinobacteraceae bacterium S3BR75-40.1]
MAKHILITGGTGFIGQHLCPELLKRGDRLTVFSRQPAAQVRALCGNVNVTDRLDRIENLDTPIDAVINLAGEGIAEKRWSEKRKMALWHSRIDLTHTLVDQLSAPKTPPDCLISASAIGFYGNQGDQTVTEKTEPFDEFSHRLCAAWEETAMRAASRGIRVCLCRTAPVLGPEAGVIAKLRLPFQLGLGGRLGTGTQYMPWIHIRDEVRAILFLLDSETAEGPYNLCAPSPVTNAQFTQTFARVLHRPAMLPVPETALKLMLGEMSRMLLTGQKAYPERLLEAGFEFDYPDLETALRDVLGKRG